jgi:hypothetical protein
MLSESDPDCTSGDFIAEALPVHFDGGTGRPVVGYVAICSFRPGHLPMDLQVVAHEMMHMLVRPLAECWKGGKWGTERKCNGVLS